VCVCGWVGVCVHTPFWSSLKQAVTIRETIRDHCFDCESRAWQPEECGRAGHVGSQSGPPGFQNRDCLHRPLLTCKGRTELILCASVHPPPGFTAVVPVSQAIGRGGPGQPLFLQNFHLFLPMIHGAFFFFLVVLGF
jgi:hypothetical protein